ncbi:MAG: N-acetyltransferase [bacterium]
MIRVRAVSTKRDLKRFINLAYKIYRGDPNWVAPLISEQIKFLSPDRNPYFHHAEARYLLAERGGEPVGRLAVHVNEEHNRYHNERAGFFGFFESVDDEEVAAALFREGEAWLKEKGAEVVRGPMNFSANDECSFLVEGFGSPPVILLTYNPPYYIDLIEGLGYVKSMDWFAYCCDDTIEVPERFRRVLRRIEGDPSIRIRNADLSDFDNEVERIKEVYKSAWGRNWGFVPPTDEEFREIAAKLRRIVDPRLVYIAEDRGRPVGFSITIPDINRALIKARGKLFPFGLLKILWHSRRIDALRVFAMGVIEGYRRRGIDIAFYSKTIEEGKRLGYKFCEMSMILEDNILMNRALQDVGARIYKRYRIYEKRI